MRLLESELDSVFDGDNPLVIVYMLRDSVEQRRLAGTGAAGDQSVDPASRRDLQHAREFGGHVPLPHHCVEGEGLSCEFAY